MIGILLSFPTSYFFYHTVFANPSMSILNFVALFLIIGIGLWCGDLIGVALCEVVRCGVVCCGVVWCRVVMRFLYSCTYIW